MLLAKAPHLSWPLRFVLPHEPHLRPRWMLRLGLFLYDHLDWHMTLPKSSRGRPAALEVRRRPEARLQEGLRLFRRLGRRCAAGDLQPEVGARDGRHASIARHRCVSARRSDDGKLWNIELDGPDGIPVHLKARGLVNAAGPWVKRFLDEQTEIKHAQARAPDQGQPHHRAAPV